MDRFPQPHELLTLPRLPLELAAAPVGLPAAAVGAAAPPPAPAPARAPAAPHEEARLEGVLAAA